MFSTIASIDVNQIESWKDKVFLTFDIDWCHDDVLDETVKILEETGVASTWFVTHETLIIERLRENPNFELGIHPNFNFLLQGDDRNGGCAEEVLDRLLELVPEAKSVRSHSMTQSSPLLDLFKSKGLTHDANHFIPHQAAIELKPWLLWNGLTKVPYFWEDDIHCMYDDDSYIKDVLCKVGLKVFDFHPIHVFLNTENMQRYESSRKFHQTPDLLLEYKNHVKRGARDILSDISRGYL